MSMHIATRNILEDSLGRAGAASSSFTSSLSELAAAGDRTIDEIARAAALVEAKTDAELASQRTQLALMRSWAERIAIDGVPASGFAELIEWLKAQEAREADSCKELHATCKKLLRMSRGMGEQVGQINKHLAKHVQGNAEGLVQEWNRTRRALMLIAERAAKWNSDGSGLVPKALGLYGDALCGSIPGAEIVRVEIEQMDGEPSYVLRIAVPGDVRSDRAKLRAAVREAHDQVGRTLPQAMGLFALRWEVAGSES